MGSLRAALDSGHGGQVFVLHGLGGCGKTAVAHALFEETVAEGTRIALWVNASDSASLRGGMLAVAADRGAAEGELMAAQRGLRAAADLAWDRLERSDRPWLLVLDNADEPAVLRNGRWLRSSERGTVVVTTRQSGSRSWPGAVLHHVDVLPGEAAAQLLCDLAPPEHRLLLLLDQRIGRALQRLGHLEESEAVNRRALARCESLLGTSAPETLESCLVSASP